MNNTTTNTLAKVKKGHLYFCIPSNRVERITETREDGTVFCRHHDFFTITDVGAFRLATREEIACYLGK